MNSLAAETPKPQKKYETEKAMPVMKDILPALDAVDYCIWYDWNSDWDAMDKDKGGKRDFCCSSQVCINKLRSMYRPSL